MPVSPHRPMRPLPSRRLRVLLALPVLLCACNRSPDRQVEERLAQASHLEETGQVAEAVRLYEEVLARAPCNDEALFRLGIQAFLRKDYERARERFQDCVGCNPEHLHCWERLGWTGDELGQNEEAARAYREANRIQPGPEYQEGEGQALYRAGKLDEAAALFRKTSEENPDDHRAVFFLANVERSLGNREKARSLYEKAIRMRPVLVEAYQNLASILFEEGRYAQAAALMERTFEAVPLDAPLDPALRYNIGICYAKAGDRGRAAMHRRKYLELAPSGAQAAMVRELLKGLEEAPPKTRGEVR